MMKKKRHNQVPRFKYDLFTAGPSNMGPVRLLRMHMYYRPRPRAQEGQEYKSSVTDNFPQLSIFAKTT